MSSGKTIVTCIEEGCTNEKQRGRKCHTCHHLRARYGINQPQRDALYTAQDGKCRVCQNHIVINGRKLASNSAVVDHCHSTGMVRGLLCNHCNRALGLFADSVASLRNAIRYLEETREPIQVVHRSPQPSEELGVSCRDI